MEQDPPVRRRIVVDGSNIATEGRTLPSLAQLDEAIRSFLEEYRGFTTSDVTVVVDASFGHRIDPSEVSAFEQALEHGEMITPPAGAVGRGDGFILRIAEKSGALVMSNDSFQEFHAERPWLFEPGRLIGGKPVPGVGWIFTPRTPVRGARSRSVTSRSKRDSQAGDGDVLVVPDGAEDTSGVAADGARRGRGTKAGGVAKTTRAAKAAKTPKAAKAAKAAKAGEAATMTDAKAAGDAKGSNRSESTNAAKATKATKATKAAKATKVTKDGKTTKAAKGTKATKSAKAVETTRTTKSAATTRSAKGKTTKAALASAPAEGPGSNSSHDAAPDPRPALKADATKVVRGAKKARTRTTATSQDDEGDGPGRKGQRGSRAQLDGDGSGTAKPAPEALNDPMTFLTFVADHPVGSTLDGTVVSFTSHGAHIDVGGMLCHVPLRGLGDPAPKRARQVLTKGETRPFVLVSLDAARRRAELALPGVVP
jgi:hypothetical protein